MHINELDVTGKIVILRIDANVPISRGSIAHDLRLAASLPTLYMLQDKGAQILIVTHIGRPEHPTQDLSTALLIPWLADHGIMVSFAHDLDDAQKKLQEGNRIVLLENIRFFQGEKTNDQAFAQKIASCGDIYINDAFASLASKGASVMSVPSYFDADHKSPGLLVEHEIQMLNRLTTQVQHPFVLIMGGAKFEKITLIESLLPKITTLLIGPALAFTFLKVQGKSVGNSKVDLSMCSLCEALIMQAEAHHVTLLYPEDYLAAEKVFSGTLGIIDAPEIQNGYVGISIGPRTAQRWSEIIMHARTIIYNGLMGTIDRIETLTYMQDIFNAMAQSKATTIVAGGDAVAALDYFHLSQNITYISTGGGVVLRYVGGMPLPALQLLKNGAKT